MHGGEVFVLIFISNSSFIAVYRNANGEIWIMRYRKIPHTHIRLCWERAMGDFINERESSILTLALCYTKYKSKSIECA